MFTPVSDPGGYNEWVAEQYMYVIIEVRMHAWLRYITMQPPLAKQSTERKRKEKRKNVYSN